MKLCRTAAYAALVLLLACGSPKPPEPCGPGNCAGCCTADGKCASGDETPACGVGGALCVDCSAIGRCGSARTCELSPDGGGGGAGGGGGGAGGGGGTNVLGDSCASPIDVVLANGVGAAVGTRASARDDEAGSCGGAGFADVVLRFTTSIAGTLTVNARPSEPNQRLVVYLRSGCGTGAAEVPGACVAAQSAGGATSMVLRNLPAGTYFLWIDGADSSAGGFEVSLNLAADRGDACGSPLELFFSSGEANVVGSTAGAIHDGTGTCGGAGGDVVYRFDVSELSNFDVTVTPRNVNLRPSVYLRGVTCTGGELGCAAAGTNGSNAFLRVGALQPGTYYLWVDNANTNSGEYELNAHLRPPAAGDTCGGPKPLTFSNGPAGGTASDNGDTSTFFANSTGSCAAGVSPDVVYTFTTNAVLDFRATATTTNTSFQPALYLRAASCDVGTERACNAAALAGGSASLAVPSLQPGTYYLWVDGAAGTAGPYALSASLTAPVPGDSCANPKALTFSNGAAGGTASDTGDLTNLFADSTGSCATGVSPDVVYTFTTNAALDFRASVSTTSGTYRPALYLRSGSCTGTEQACGAAAVAGGTASIAIGSLPPGTYYLWVDAVTGNGGPYSLSASLTAPAPGEGCGNPKTLSFSNGAAGGNATDTGNTTTSFADSTGTCASGTAADVVYSFTTNAVLDLQATVTTTAGTYQPAMYLPAATCSTSERACVAAPAPGGTATLTVQGLTPGTYYLWVDGIAGTSGPFSLSASLTSPPAEEVRPRPITNVPVSSPMEVGFEVVNRYGTVMTNDSTTSFTVGAGRGALGRRHQHGAGARHQRRGAAQRHRHRGRDRHLHRDRQPGQRASLPRRLVQPDIARGAVSVRRQHQDHPVQRQPGTDRQRHAHRLRARGLQLHDRVRRRLHGVARGERVWLHPRGHDAVRNELLHRDHHHSAGKSAVVPRRQRGRRRVPAGERRHLRDLHDEQRHVRGAVVPLERDRHVHAVTAGAGGGSARAAARRSRFRMLLDSGSGGVTRREPCAPDAALRPAAGTPARGAVRAPEAADR